MSETAEELARRTPPGQVLTKKWPVLTYGLPPRFDPPKWSFRCFGLVEHEVSFTWEEFLALPRTEPNANSSNFCRGPGRRSTARMRAISSRRLKGLVT